MDALGRLAKLAALIVSISTLASALADCGPGCIDCNNSICSLCFDSMYLNEGVCTFCDDGQFYNPSLATCQNCGSSCSNQCAYQLSCFTCSSTQVYSLAQLKCVDACASNEVLIASSLIHGLRVCRKLVYYVNPSSESILELGTQVNPYKNINLPLFELFNFVDASNQNVTVKISQDDTHYLAHSQLVIANVLNITFEPYNPNTNSSFYSASTRALFVFKDNNVSFTSNTTRFNLQTLFELDSKVVSTFGVLGQTVINQNFVSLIAIRTAITFKNIRFEDDFIESTDKITSLQAYKLETKQFALINVDIKLTCSIMISNHPFNFVAQNIKIIDFYNINSGFLFQTQCNYVGASLVGNILFDKLAFTYESDKLFKFKTGQFINIYAPANVTISNSVFNVEYSSVESYDAFLLEDNGDCSPDDNITQSISIINNTFAFNGDYDKGFNNIRIAFNDANKRNKTILVDSNTFTDLHGVSKTLLEIEYLSTGKVTVCNNVVRNCSSDNYLFSLEANQNIEVIGNKFDSCIISSAGLIVTNIASSISISNLTVFNNINSDSYSRSSLIHLAGAMNSEMSITSSNFYLNSLNSTMIDIDNSVGSISISDSRFYNETLKSTLNYILFDGLYALQFKNCSFLNINDDQTSSSKTLLIYFNSISIRSVGAFTLDSLTFTNNSVSFIVVNSISGTATTLKTITFSNMTVSDSTFQTKNSIITIGPIYNFNEFQFVFNKIEFNNLIFVKDASLIHIVMQAKYSLIVQNCVVQNIQGGGFQLEPVSVIDETKKVLVSVNNMLIANNDFQSSAFFVVANYCTLTVSNCTMKRNSAYFLGTILSIIDRKSTVSFDQCNFNNNNGVLGGLFYVERSSIINVNNSYIFGNFAVNSPVAFIENSGSINFDNCEISFSVSLTVGMLQITDSINLSTISNSVIYSNSFTSKDILVKDINDTTICIVLCFASDGFVAYLSENMQLLDQQFLPELITLSRGYLTMNNCSFYNMNKLSIIKAFGAVLSLSQFNIYSMNFIQDGMWIVSTNFTMNNFNVSNLTKDATAAAARFIRIEESSIGVIHNCAFEDQNFSLMSVTNSQIQLLDCSLNNITSKRNTIEFLTSNAIMIKNLTTYNLYSSKQPSVFGFNGCSVDEISDSNFTETEYRVFVFQNTIVKNFDNNLLNTMNKGIQFIAGSIGSITNTTISNMVQNIKSGTLYQSNISSDGSAIEIIDSNVTIDNCSFINNTSRYGGAIFINCNYMDVCSNTIQNSAFNSNAAQYEGGAIMYNSYAPVLVNNSFANNSALFNNDIANYAVKIRKLDSSGILSDIVQLNDVPSGLKIENSINFAVVSVDENQIMISDSSSYIRFYAVENNTEVQGQTTVLLTNGKASFSNTIFVASPGRSNVKFLVESSAINYKVVQHIDKVKYASQYISVNFRWCKPGEIHVGNTCIACGIGSYSVVWNETKCHNCPDNAACEGVKISLNQGYWRFDKNSTDITECPNSDACLGGFNDNSTYPVYCADGYEGVLCDECVMSGDNKYERISDNQCSKCPDPVLNLIRIIGFGILILIFMIIIILVNIQKKEDSNVSVLMRIMTNYLQMLSAALAFNLQFPNYVMSLFSSVKQAGSSTGVFLSYDCLLINTRATEIFNNVSYLKVMCIGFIPIILISVSIACYRVAFLHDSLKFKRWSCVTAITVLFLLYPSLTQYCLRIFKCVNAGNGVSRVEMDIVTDCWSSVHIKWIISLAIPMLLVYVIGAPLTAFLILFKNRKNLDHPEVVKYILLLYQGLRHEVYYWELINTIRKLTLLCLYVFIPDSYNIVKALIGVFILFVCSMAQFRLKPFKIGIISTLEHREMLSTMITLYGGLIFVQGNQLSGLSIGFFVLIVFINLRFILLWTYCVVTVYKSKLYIDMIRSWMKKTFCIKVEQEDEDFLCYKSKSQSTIQELNSKEKRSKRTTDNKLKQRTNIKMISKNESNVTYGSCYKNDMDQEVSASARTPKKLLVRGNKNERKKLNEKQNVKFNISSQVKRRKQKKKQAYKTEKMLIEESKEERDEIYNIHKNVNQTTSIMRTKNALKDTKSQKFSMNLTNNMSEDTINENSKRELFKHANLELDHHYFFENSTMTKRK